VDEYIPIVRLYKIFDVKPVSTKLESGLLVVVEAEGKIIAVYVDDLLGQQRASSGTLVNQQIPGKNE